MTLDDLLDVIHKSKQTSIGVQPLRAKHGNKDQAGDYDILKVTIGTDTITINKTEGGWVIQG